MFHLETNYRMTDAVSILSLLKQPFQNTRCACEEKMVLEGAYFWCVSNKKMTQEVGETNEIGL